MLDTDGTKAPFSIHLLRLSRLAMTTLKSVNVVKVNDLAKGENMTALDAAVKKNNLDITAQRSAMTANGVVNTALVDAKVDVSTVVAADIASEGILTVYVR